MSPDTFPNTLAGAPLLVLFVKATLLVLAGTVAAGSLTLLRMTAPATRAALWNGVTFMLLLLPMLSLVVPKLRVIPRPPHPVTSVAFAVHEPPPALQSPSTPSAVAAPSLASRPRVDVENPGDATPGGTTVTARTYLQHLPGWFALAWLAGTLLLLLRLARSIDAVRCIVRQAHRYDPSGDDLFSSLTGRRVSRAASSARVLLSAEVAVPITTASLRPVIVLPAAARSWTAARLRIALLHELSHVTRRDHLTHLLGEVVCALYWPNPLVWWMAARARLAREIAADASVLEQGIEPAAYAQELVSFARSAVAPRYAAVSLAAKGPLADRVRAIMSVATRPRVDEVSDAGRLGSAGVVGAVGAWLTVAAAVAALSFVVSPTQPLRLDAVEVSRFGVSADSALYALLFDDVAARRHEAARFIADAGEDRRAVVRAELVAMFSDTCRGPRWRAARVFRHLADGRAVAQLVEQLVRDDDLYVRAMLAQAIAASDADAGARGLRRALAGVPRARIAEVDRAIDTIGEATARATLRAAARAARHETPGDATPRDRIMIAG